MLTFPENIQNKIQRTIIVKKQKEYKKCNNKNLRSTKQSTKTKVKQLKNLENKWKIICNNNQCVVIKICIKMQKRVKQEQIKANVVIVIRMES